jgi:thiamine-phosphate pyrophosphorylase
LKAAKEIRAITLSYNAIFIINDRIDIALICDADGVHLGLADIDIIDARRLLGAEKLIGLSTHSINEAKEAIRLGADYISYGPIFKTQTKLDAHPPGGLDGLGEVSAAIKESRVPITAIGGVTQDSIAGTIATGASMVAVISEILLATDIPARVRELIKEIGSPAKVR